MRDKPDMKRHYARLALFAFSGYLLLLNLGVVWYATRTTPTEATDFSSFYAAARMLRSGNGADLYNARSQQAVQAMLFPASRVRIAPFLYYHPPFELLAFLPLSYLPLPVAQGIWAGLSLALFAVSAVLFRPELDPLADLWKPGPWMVFACYFPAIVTLLQGQDSIVLLFLVVLSLRSLKSGKEATAGAWLGLGCFKFHLALPLAAMLVLAGNRKLLYGLAPVLLALVALSAFLVGPGGLMAYVQAILQINRGASLYVSEPGRIIFIERMTNLRGLISMIALRHLGHLTVFGIIAAASLLLMLWAAHRSRRLSSREKVAVAAAIAVLVSYHGHVHDMVLLVLPVGLLLARITSSFLSTASAGGILITAVLYATPLYLVLYHRDMIYLIALPVIALVFMLLGWGPTGDVKMRAGALPTCE